VRAANGRLPSRTLRPVVRRALSVTRAAVRGANDADPVEACLGELDRDELVELIGRLADAVPGVDATLSTEAVAAGHRGAVDAAELARQVTASLPRSRFVDYRESYAVARAAEEVLDRLEELLDVGAADAVSKALLRATTRLRSILLHADDSSGVIGAAGERAVQLYARACREGTPNRVSLARWLVGFRRDSPGWPHVELAMFVDRSMSGRWLSTAGGREVVGRSGRRGSLRAL
jgi:hypothetical protein